MAKAPTAKSRKAGRPTGKLKDLKPQPKKSLKKVKKVVPIKKKVNATGPSEMAKAPTAKNIKKASRPTGKLKDLKPQPKKSLKKVKKDVPIKKKVNATGPSVVSKKKIGSTATVQSKIKNSGKVSALVATRPEMENYKPQPSKRHAKKKSSRRGKPKKNNEPKITPKMEQHLMRLEEGRLDKDLKKKYERKRKPVVAKKNMDVDPTKLINMQVLETAVSGLRKLMDFEKFKEEKSLQKVHDITDDDDCHVFLQVTLRKLPEVTSDLHLTGPANVTVHLPHSLVTDNTDVILITKDLERGIRPDHQNTLDHFKTLLRAHDAASLVNEVISLRQLKTEYKDFEAKRHLANRTEVLLCDDTVMRFLPKFLSKHFYIKKRLPVQVNLKAKNLQQEILRALAVSRLFFSLKGNSSIMKIGRLRQTDEEIKENVLEAVRKLAIHSPGQWKNIQNLSLKLEKSLSIPLHVNTNSMNTAKAIPAKTPFPGEPVSGTLSTQPGSLITVYPDGSVTSLPLKKQDQRVMDGQEQTKQEQEKNEKKGAEQKDVESTKLRKKNKSIKRKVSMLEGVEEEEPKATKIRKKKKKEEPKETKTKKVMKQNKENADSNIDLDDNDDEGEDIRKKKKKKEPKENKIKKTKKQKKENSDSNIDLDDDDEGEDIRKKKKKKEPKEKNTKKTKKQKKEDADSDFDSDDDEDILDKHEKRYLKQLTEREEKTRGSQDDEEEEEEETEDIWADSDSYMEE